MKRLFAFISLALALFGVVLTDVASEFTLLSLGGAVAVGLACLCSLLLLARSRPLRSNAIPAALLLSSLAAVACRLGGYETVARRPPSKWEAYRQTLADTIANRVTEGFTALCRRARQTAERLAQEAVLSQAVADAKSLPDAFQLLEQASLPRAVQSAASGVTLYGGGQTPLAWGGENADLGSYLEADDSWPSARSFILTQSVFVHLVVREPLPRGEGAVTIEIPLAARRRLDNRYLTDYEAVTQWAGKSISTDYVDSREEAPELAHLFEKRGDRFWGDSARSRMLYFALRTPSGELVGVSSLAAEDPPTAVLEARRSTLRLAGIFLALAALASVALLARRLWGGEGLRQNLATAILLTLSLWVLRAILLLSDLPLGLGTDLDDPALYASDVFFHLLRSPVDFLATALVVVLCTIALSFPWLAREPAPAAPVPALLARILIRCFASASVLGLLVLTNGLIYDTWINSNLSLTSIELFPPDLPRLAVQLGLLALCLASAVISIWLFTSAERWAGSDDSRTARKALHHWALDILVFATGYAIFSRADASSWFVASLPALLAFDLLAIRRKPLLEALTRSRIYLRFATTLVLLTTSVLVFYPAMAHFEERIIRQFVETSVASAVIHHGDSQLFVLQETLEAIDRMEAAGQLRLPEKANVAYQIWSGSDLAVSSLSSSVEVYDEDGVLLSRFALNLSPDLSRDQLSEPPPQQWIIEEVSHPGEPHRPHLLQARRAISDGEGGRWDFQVRLLADWSNLPFITTPNPYIDLFRSPQTEAPLPFSGRELALYVFDLDGSPIFRSSESLLTLDAEPPHETAKGRRWMERELDGRPHHVLAFSDSQHLFALSYPAKPSLAYAAEVAGWTLLSALVAATLLLGVILIGTAGEPMSLRPRDIWTEVGVSFYGKLLVAFIFLALLPIVALAFVVRGVVIQQLETDVERAGLAQAQVVERFVQEFLTYQRLDPNERGVAAVTDPVLEWVGSLVGADVDLYRHGALVATSKRELFDSGLLSTRAVPGVYRRIVLDRVNHAFHRESVGRFHYLVVSVPIVVEPWGEPGVLSMPLASRQREIDRNVTSLNRTVLLVALCFCLAAAVLAYSLARRIAEPINTLTRATRHVAQGDFAISLRPQSRDEIGTLFDSFNQMTSDLQRQRRDLERTKKLEAWAEMARQIAHEVKNPLTPIQLSTEHLRRVADDPQVDFKKLLKDCTETILQQVRTLRQISMEFSTFASSTSLHPEPTDFGRLVAEVLEPYRRTPPRNVQVTLDVAPELPPIAVDRRLMQRTLVNLLENALHALNGEGRVSVTVRAARSSGRQWVEVVVSDDGPGIDPELREHVFEPYFSTRAAGTGLGLAIARKTVEEHGGTISLESEEGKGTQVTLRLPVEETSMQESSGPP